MIAEQISRIRTSWILINEYKSLCVILPHHYTSSPLSEGILTDCKAVSLTMIAETAFIVHAKCFLVPSGLELKYILSAPLSIFHFAFPYSTICFSVQIRCWSYYYIICEHNFRSTLYVHHFPFHLLSAFLSLSILDFIFRLNRISSPPWSPKIHCSNQLRFTPHELPFLSCQCSAVGLSTLVLLWKFLFCIWFLQHFSVHQRVRKMAARAEMRQGLGYEPLHALGMALFSKQQCLKEKCTRQVGQAIHASTGIVFHCQNEWLVNGKSHCAFVNENLYHFKEIPSS